MGCEFTVAQASCLRAGDASSFAERNAARRRANLHAGSVRYVMFTGIVEETGIVERINPAAKSIELTVRTYATGRGLKTGDSLAVNGCCLTAIKISTRGKAKLIQFDLLRETWRLTNLQFAKPGSLVNLERPLRADGEFGGHFVTGHIDGVGKIVRWERAGQDHVLDIIAPPEVMRYIIHKGSIAVDGISLTVAGVRKKRFRIWIIPHTLEVTALRERKIGDAVNLEADLLGKYVEKVLAARGKK
jgi:riboflavin synthase